MILSMKSWGSPQLRIARCRGAITEVRTISRQRRERRSASVGRAAAQQMPIAMFDHPFGAGQMALEGALRASWLAIRIDVQHDLRDFAPIGALRRLRRAAADT